jgi:hypothetical protein
VVGGRIIVMKKFLLLVGLVFFSGSAFAARCVSGDCINGYGVYEFDSGNKYKGESKGGLEHGQGTFTFANGDVEK